jgi:SAM-dependent methyltransferase
MTAQKNRQQAFWEQAGEDGYGETMFNNTFVEQHIRSTIWDEAIKTAKLLELNSDSRVLELGCGDGTFAVTTLAKNFASIDGYDRSVSAIKRCNTLYKSKALHFHVSNVIELDYAPGQYWDGAFLMGFLHHVKEKAAVIVSRLAKVAPLVVVVDPNGDNPIRKTLELLPSYRQAGEDSFRLNELKSIFSLYGYELVSQNQVSVVPPFTPTFLLPPMIYLEKIIESNRILKKISSTYILGFKRVG